VDGSRLASKPDGDTLANQIGAGNPKMRRRDFIAGVGGSAAAAVFSTVPSVAQALPRAERPDIKIGDSSVYQDRNVRTGEKRETRHRLVSIDADRIVTEIAGGTSGTQTFTRDWNLVENKTGDTNDLTVKPFWPRLRFPLEVGQKWNTPFEVRVSTLAFKRTAKWQWKAQVARVEQVTVPGGTYQAFRIECDGTFATVQENFGRGTRSFTGSHKETIWYAPEVMRIVKRDFQQSVPANNFFDQHVVELLSFMPAP
jgi:hypothetical protein